MLRKELIQIVIVLHLREGLGQGWNQSGAVHGGAGLDIHVVFVFVFRLFSGFWSMCITSAAYCSADPGGLCMEAVPDGGPFPDQPV